MKTRTCFRLVFVSLFCLPACSDVKLTYGGPLNGLVSLSDRNRNALNPGGEERYAQAFVPVPSSTPRNPGSGDGSGSRSPLPQAGPRPVPDSLIQITGSEESPTPPALKLRVIPGAVSLTGFGNEQQLQLLLQDSEGRVLDLNQYEFLWESLSPNLLAINAEGVVRSLTTSGSYLVRVSLKSDPRVTATVTVTIASASGGGGGGGGGATPLPVRVTAMSQTAGEAGNSVTLTVTGFNPLTTSPTVSFAGHVQATITNSTANTITVTVPEGAETGYITVSTSEGSAESPEEFLILQDNITGIVIFQ